MTAIAVCILGVVLAFALGNIADALNRIADALDGDDADRSN
jgi:hypothetical protein